MESIISKLMNNAKTPIAVTGRFYHRRASDLSKHYVTEEEVRKMLAEQYGEGHEFVAGGPGWLKKGGSFSVCDGNLGFEEDRIA